MCISNKYDNVILCAILSQQYVIRSNANHQLNTSKFDFILDSVINHSILFNLTRYFGPKDIHLRQDKRNRITLLGEYLTQENVTFN